MRKLKILLALSFVICFCLCPSVIAYATDGINLDCGVSVSATMENNSPVLYVTNNSGKDILSLSIFVIQCDGNEEIDNTSAAYYFSSIPNGETSTLHATIFLQNNTTGIKVFPCRITFADYTYWGATNDSFALSKEITNGFSVKNTITHNSGESSVSSNSNNSLLDAFSGLLMFLVPVIAIVVFTGILWRKYKLTGYFKDTGIPYFTMRGNKGLYGEYLTREILEKTEGYKKFLNNLYLDKGDGKTTEVDLVMIHTSGIYVIESKNYSGWIFGNEKSQQWMQTLKNGEKHQFYNPIYQNKLHVKALQQTLNLPDNIPFHSIVVFSERCTFKDVVSTTVPVVHRNDISKEVSNFASQTPNVLSEEKIDEIYRILYPRTRVSEEVKKQHIENIKH